MDGNIWHLSHEGGDLENPWNEPKDDLYLIITPPEKAPDTPTYVEIEFEKGIPVAVNGEKLGAVELLEKLNNLGAANGVGIDDIVENRLIGMKSRGVYETPGGTILYKAHQELEYLTLDRQTMHYKELVASKYTELVYDGMWFTTLREALDAFVDVTQETCTGTVRMKLYKGNCVVAGVKSDYSLYSEDLATFEESDYNQGDSAGFINLFGLPIKTKAMLMKKSNK